MSLFYENFRDFEDAGKAILEYLHNHLGFNLWMIEFKKWFEQSNRPLAKVKTTSI